MNKVGRPYISSTKHCKTWILGIFISSCLTKAYVLRIVHTFNDNWWQACFPHTESAKEYWIKWLALTGLEWENCPSLQAMANDCDWNNIRMRDTQFISMFWLKTLENWMKCILPCSVATVATDAFRKNRIMSQGNWLKLWGYLWR